MKYNKNIGPLKHLISNIHYLVYTSYTILYFVQLRFPYTCKRLSLSIPTMYITFPFDKKKKKKHLLLGFTETFTRREKKFVTSYGKGNERLSVKIRQSHNFAAKVENSISSILKCQIGQGITKITGYFFGKISFYFKEKCK